MSIIPELSVNNINTSLGFYTSYGFTVDYGREAEGFAMLTNELGARLMLDQYNLGRSFDRAL